MRPRLTVGELATLGERCLGGATPSPLMERAVADLVAERVAEVIARVEAAACMCGGDGVRFTVGADRRCPVHGYGDTVSWRHLREALRGGA